MPLWGLHVSVTVMQTFSQKLCLVPMPSQHPGCQHVAPGGGNTFTSVLICHATGGGVAANNGKAASEPAAAAAAAMTFPSSVASAPVGGLGFGSRGVSSLDEEISGRSTLVFLSVLDVFKVRIVA